VAALLTQEALQDVAAEPAAALRLLRAAARHAAASAAASAPDARTVAAQSLTLAKEVRTKEPPAPQGDLAQAYALACYARTTAAVGGQTTRPDWSEAVDLLKGAHALQPGQGEHLALAVDLLVDWSAVAADEGPSALAEASALSQAGLKALPGSVALRMAAARADLRAGLMGLAAKKESAKAVLVRALDMLFSNVAELEKDPGAVRAYHAALRQARLAGLATKAQYVLDRLPPKGLMEAGCPRGEGWEVGAPEGKAEEELFLRLRKWVPDTGWLFVELWTKRWDLNYTWNDNPVAGDNVPGMVEASRKSIRAWLADVKSDKPLKGRASKALPDAVGYELTGTHPDEGRGTYRAREWWFKSEQRKLSWRISVVSHGETTDRDPEVEAILASLKEWKDPKAR
jgi:hypothetical protein